MTHQNPLYQHEENFRDSGDKYSDTQEWYQFDTKSDWDMWDYWELL